MKPVFTSSNLRNGARNERVATGGVRLAQEQAPSIIAIVAIIITAEVRAE